MPRVTAEYIVDYWNDLGLVEYSSMGAIPLSSAEIDAWSRGSSTELMPWEFRALRQMSKDYLSSLNSSEDPATPPPYGKMAQEYDRGVVQKKLVNQFKSFMMAGNQ